VFDPIDLINTNNKEKLLKSVPLRGEKRGADIC
jgi:hypothetical protein